MIAKISEYGNNKLDLDLEFELNRQQDLSTRPPEDSMRQTDFGIRLMTWLSYLDNFFFQKTVLSKLAYNFTRNFGYHFSAQIR